MAEKLKIIPLGGLNEIGKNMTAYEYGGEIIVVDCGMAFPGDDMYGIDCVIPDVSYLIKNKSRIRGLFITHGHEDHIGAIPYVLKQINMPIYCTRFTAGLIKLKLEEHQLVKSTKLITVEAGKSVRAGKFTVEFIHVNHSIADSVAFAIHTKMGTIVHTGDFKIDSTPIDGEVIDLARLGELGKEGVLCLCADSTNVERPGFTPSEKTVGATFMRQFQNCDERIIVTTFASNVHRVQQVLDAAAQCGRKVAVTGRSMENMMKVSTELGYMKVPKNTLVDINRIKGLPKNTALIRFLSQEGMRKILLETEAHYLQDNAREMPVVTDPLYFVIDEKNRSVELTDKGIDELTGRSEDPQFFVLPDIASQLSELEHIPDPAERQERKDELMANFAVKSERVHTVTQLLKAYTLFMKDQELSLIHI